MPANVPWELYLVLSNAGPNAGLLYKELHTTIDLAGLYDLLEVATVQGTWEQAAYDNAKAAPPAPVGY